MAGTAVPTKIEHRSRGVVRTDITLTCDASGDATETVVGVGFGKLVGAILKSGTLASNAVITVKDKKGLAAILTLSPYKSAHPAIFGSTTTGDTTGGTSEDLWSTGAVHNLLEGDAIVFTSLTGNGVGGPTLGTTYYVVTATGFAASTFCLSDTAAHALAGTDIVDVGATDASAASWYKAASAAALLRPSGVITSNVGVAVTAADTAPNVNRDIVLGGKVSVVVSGGGNLGAGELVLIVDEEGLGEPAQTV